MTKQQVRLTIKLWLVITMVFSICLFRVNITSAEGPSITDYFEINYHSEISETNIQPGERFTAHIVGNATCIQDSPVYIEYATIKSRVVAQLGMTTVVLNSEYVINISPFPNNKDESYSIDEYIILQFPSGSTPGVYDVIGELILAEVQVSTYPDPINISDFLPSSQSMGSVTCIAVEPTPTPSPTPTPTSSYAPPSNGGGIIFIPSPTPSPTSSPTPSQTTSTTPSPVRSPTPSPTTTVTTTPTASPAQSLTPSPTSSPTLSPSPSPTLGQTPSVTSSPVPSPTSGTTPVSSDDSDFQWWWIVFGLIILSIIVVASVLWWRHKST